MAHTMHAPMREDRPFDPHGLVVRDGRWPAELFHTSYNGYYVPTSVFDKAKAQARPTLSPVPYVPARAPLMPRLPPPPPKTGSLSSIVNNAPRTTLPPFRTLIGPRDGQDDKKTCTAPVVRELFFPPPPITRVPAAQLISRGLRWIEEPEMRISWCVVPEQRAPEPRWPSQRSPASVLNGSNSSPAEDIAGASQADSEELRLPTALSVSRFLGLDPTFATLSDYEGTPPASPLSENSDARDAQHLAGPRASPGASGASSDDEPLRVAIRTRQRLPGIASLNLPKPRTARADPTPAPTMDPRPVIRRPVRRPRIALSDSEEDRPRLEITIQSPTPSEHAPSPRPTPTPSASSSSSTSDAETDELDDDEDDYVPRPRKRKAAPHGSEPPKKRGPAARPDKHYQCPDCPLIFEYGTRLNEHALIHAETKGNITKPFQCKQCNQGFGRIWDLERHLLTHSGEKPFQCKYCERGYNRNDALLRHMRQGKPGHPKPKPKTR